MQLQLISTAAEFQWLRRGAGSSGSLEKAERDGKSKKEKKRPRPEQFAIVSSGCPYPEWPTRASERQPQNTEGPGRDQANQESQGGFTWLRKVILLSSSPSGVKREIPSQRQAGEGPTANKSSKVSRAPLRDSPPGGEKTKKAKHA